MMVKSRSQARTEHIAEVIGQRLRGGEVIELVSDLGGGKTTFVRGLARGLGSTDHVSSPTFKISNIYKTKHLELHHYDFYRLGEAGIVADELAETIGQPDVVTVVEWGGAVKDVLPTQRLTITIKTTGESARELAISFPEESSYLAEGIC